jgi:hypothetical protein
VADNSRKQIAALVRMFTKQNPATNILVIVRGLAETAKRELRRNGVHVPKKTKKYPKGRGWPQLPKDASPHLRRLLEIIFTAASVEHWMSAELQAHFNALAETCKLGQLGALAFFGPDLWKDWKSGRKSRASGIAEQIKRYGPLSERKKKYQPLLLEFERLKQGGMSERGARNHLGLQYNLSPSTIRHRIKIALS